MKEQSIEHQLRRFLLGVAAFIFLGSIAELLLIEHYEELPQWVPFLSSGVGLLSIITVWVNPGKETIRAMQIVMVLIAISSLTGIYLHFSGNLAFTREINPSYTLAESLLPALKGSYPLLAPGILFLGGILALASVYQHPRLKKTKKNRS